MIGCRRLAGFAATLLLLSACTAGGAARPDPSQPPPEGLRPIATDDCPASEELLSEQEARAAGGERLPNVTLPCIGSDRVVPLHRLGGLPTVVNVWASWCLPCIKEMPALQEVYAVAEGRVRFLGLNVADATENSARKIIQDTGVAYPSVRAEGRQLLNKIGVPGPPVTLFVDGRGRIVRLEVGALTAAELRAKIREHLGVEVAPLR